MKRLSLKHAMETVRREVEQSPDWLKEIYERNRIMREQAKASTKEEAKMLLDEGTRLVQSKRIGKSLQPKDGPKPKRTAPSPKTAGEPKTFMQKVRAGLVEDPRREANRLVRSWYIAPYNVFPYNQELPEFLGMTRDEYAEFVINPTAFFEKISAENVDYPTVEVFFDDSYMTLEKFAETTMESFTFLTGLTPLKLFLRFIRVLVKRNLLTEEDVKFIITGR